MQSPNTFSPSVVRVAGMATLCNDTQLKKARSPMLFSDCEDGILLRETQSEKAELPMDCKESIAPMLVREVQEEKAFGAITCTFRPPVTVGRRLQP